MIIWLDGTFGVGKTTIAYSLKDKFGDSAEVLDSDCYKEFHKKDIEKWMENPIENNNEKKKIGTLLQNDGNFIEEFKNLIEEKAIKNDKKLIVTMALTEKKCKEALFDCLKKEQKDMIHIILTAEENNIIERIKKDENKSRDKHNALEWLKPNIDFLEKNYPNDIWIKTDNRDIDSIVDEIIKIIESKEK